MTTKEITITNISCFFQVGKSVRGKGAQLLTRSIAFDFTHEYSAEESRKKFCEKVLKGIEEGKDLYIDTYRKGADISMQYKSAEESQKENNLKELAKNGFDGYSAVYIKVAPKTIGYISISKYNSSKESQTKLIKDILKLDGQEIYGDELYESEYDFEYVAFDFSKSDKKGNRYNGDYLLEHGDCPYVENKSDCNFVDGRVYGHYRVIDDFWDFDLDCHKEWFKEIDPNETIAVYHRKGKDWYFGYTLASQDIYLTYIDEDGELIEEEQFYALTYTPNQTLLETFVQWAKDVKRELKIKSYINTELEIYDGYQEVSNNNGLFNLKVIDNHFDEDRVEAARCISNYADWEDNTTSPEALVAKAYDDWLAKNIKGGVLLDKYKHLKQLEQIIKDEEKQLVYSRIGDFTEDMGYAIKFKGEEYHFSLGELFNSNPKKFYREITQKLTKRLLERYEQSLLVQKAKTVFVGIDDSYSSGNCKSGTAAWCSKFGIDTNKIGGIRGDEVLRLDFNNFTKRAVIQAIANHEKLA